MSARSSVYGLVLDIQASQSVLHGDRGIARFVIEHARALMAVPGLVRGLLINPLLPFPGHLPVELLASPLLDWGTATSFRRASRVGPTAYHLMSPFELRPAAVETIVPPYALRPDVPLVATLYDLIPLVMPETHLSEETWARRYHARLELIRQADLLLAISEHSRRDAIQLLGLDPDRVVAVGGGVSPYFRPASPGVDPGEIVRRAVPKVARPFVLTVVGDDARKNTEGLLLAYAELPAAVRATYQLVVTCRLSPDVLGCWAGQAQVAGLAEDEVVFTGYVPDEVLLALYQAATLFIFPSLYEGFGLPVAEAAACGCPALASNTSSLPEILDWEPATFDPRDPSSMAAKMAEALTNDSFRLQLKERASSRASLHTWRAVAERTVEALERLPTPASRGPKQCPAPLRVGLVGPFPPTRSGIADYNARLAAELARRCELDVFSSEKVIPPISGAQHFLTGSLGTIVNPAAYDALIYTVGNNQHHHDTFDVARRYPGIVWFHDVHLGGQYLTYAADRLQIDPQQFVAVKLQELYADRAPAHVVGAYSLSHSARYGLGFTAEWARSARAVLVNSRFAEQLLRLDQGPDRVLPPLWRVPFAVPSAPDLEPVAVSSAPLIASFGIVHPVKGLDHLLEALRFVRAEMPTELVFVGSSEYAGSSEELEARIAELGLAGHVTFTGYVSKAEYQWWLRRATCAVQLRMKSGGESSAALADCLAAGLPTIANMIGIQDELPPDTVVMLDPALTVEELAIQIVSLLQDPMRRERHRSAALAYARQTTFAHLADRLVEVVKAVGETGSVVTTSAR